MARADEDGCRERILSPVGGSFFPPDKSESGSDRCEWNGTLDISSLFPATKSETDGSSVFSCSNSNSIMAIFPPDRSTKSETDGSSVFSCSNSNSIMAIFPPDRSQTDGSENYVSVFSCSNSNSIMAISPPDRSQTDGSENYETTIIAQNPSISSLFPAHLSDTTSSVSYEIQLLSLGIKKLSLLEAHILDWNLLAEIRKLSLLEVHILDWDLLDKEMKEWIRAVKIVISGEKSYCDQISCGANKTKVIWFDGTLKRCVMQLLDFGKAVAISRRSPEKLFRILDMYKVMAEALARLEVLITDVIVINEARVVLFRLGEAACRTFAEFENAVQSEALKKPMLRGEIHPLTQYVMNNVKLIVDYSDTMNLLLRIPEDDDQLEPLRNDDSSLKLTPLARRLLVLITSLHTNLEEKSKLYEDGALRYIFLMNNIQYVMQKVKDSDLGGLFGNNWVRERRGQIRKYAWNYFWASWTKVLHCLKDGGIGGNWSNAHFEERFKNFNTYFEEIYRVQTAWKVPDAELRKVLRIFISKKVIPTYRSFMGGFGNQVDSGRHAGNYMKYTADDLWNYLLELFEGSPRVLHEEKNYIG